MTMQTPVDLRAVSDPIANTDVLFGWDGNDATINAPGMSVVTEVLERLGLHLGYSTTGAAPWTTSSTGATHFRIASGVTRPAAASARWSAGIPLGAANLMFSDIGGQIADAQIPASIMRDSEFTATAVRNLLSLTSAEANDLFTGATILGQTLTFTQNDGTTVQIAIPTATPGAGDGVVQSGALVNNGADLQLTLDNGGMITIDIAALATDVELNARAPLASPVFTGDPTAPTPASGDNDTSIATTEFVATGFATLAALNALTARVAALEAGGGPTPHMATRYAALRATGAMPADFTEADFTGGSATTSTDGDIYTPASNDDMVVGIAVPMSEGVLTALVEIDANGDENPFGLNRSDFLPNLGDTAVTLDISGESHYVYCTDAIVRGLFLGVIGFRLTQG